MVGWEAVGNVFRRWAGRGCMIRTLVMYAKFT